MVDPFVEGVVSFITAAMPQGFAWVTALFMVISLAVPDRKKGVLRVEGAMDAAQTLYKKYRK